MTGRSARSRRPGRAAPPAREWKPPSAISLETWVPSKINAAIRTALARYARRQPRGSSHSARGNLRVLREDQQEGAHQHEHEPHALVARACRRDLNLECRRSNDPLSRLANDVL